MVDPVRTAFEKYRDDRNAALEAEGHIPGSKWHIDNNHYPTWQAAFSASSGQCDSESVAHVFPDDLEKLETSECAVTAYSVPMGDPDRGKTLPLYHSDPLREAEIKAQAVEQAFAQLVKEYEPLGLQNTYTAFDVAQHIEAQTRHYAGRLRSTIIDEEER